MLLQGTRVLACENGLAGPLCSRLLADLGADVVKLERPRGGDVTRGWDTVAGGLSSGFVWMNRGKRSVALDVKDPASRPALEALVASSDVFLQNFTPGWAEGVGLDEPSVRALRRDIVYTEITGYGASGPYAARNAYDLVMQGEAGLASITGSPEQPARVGVSISDLGAGSYAAVATCAALVRRERTGEGAHVSVSLFDTMVDWLGYFPHLWWHRRELPARAGLRHPHFCPYGAYPAEDGKLFMLAVLSEERYATNEGRVAARDELEPRLEELLRSRPAATWLERLVGAGVPCGAVNDVRAVMEHPQLHHNALLADIGSPVGPLPTVGNPFLVWGERLAVGAVPGLGEHTREVLGEVDVDGTAT